MYESSEMQTTDANGDRVTVPFVTLPLLGPSLSDVRHRGHALPARCTLVRSGECARGLWWVGVWDALGAYISDWAHVL